MNPATLAWSTWPLSIAMAATLTRVFAAPAAGVSWDALSRELQSAAAQGKDVTRALEIAAPAIARSLKADAKRAAWKKLWGLSLNRDEHAGGTIVDPAVTRAIDHLAQVAPPKGDVVHAGIQHTYGYLFSTLKTPFGFKRERWVSGELERGFGLPAGLLGPEPSRGTLFSNVTFFAGSIAFRGDARRLAALHEGQKGIPRQMTSYDFSSLKIDQVIERAAGVELRTDLVVMPRAAGHRWLVYSTVEPGHGARLITAFPVEEGFALKLLDPKAMGPGREITTHYNGYVAGLTGRNAEGERVMESRR